MSCQNNLSEQIKLKILSKYDYLQPEEVDTCYDKSLADYLRIKYPSDNNRPKPENVELNFMTTQWILARMEDILERAGGTNVTAYKENGISFTYGASYIDPSLVLQLMPKAGIPK